jgi:putative endonuclease
MKAFYVYIMTNQSRVVLYTGITNTLMRRVWQHQSGEIEGFTKSYNVNRLVYYECFDHPRDAIAREKEDQRLATSEEECISRNEESEVGRFISDAFSKFQTFLAYFNSYRQTQMIESSSRALCVLRGPSLRSG